ncbi:MAG: DUF2975 domain-containing protein [Flavobacteriales bacterium]|nr:DUF2975 domain-containing protein [Flavobacteriales bacterium]
MSQKYSFIKAVSLLLKAVWYIQWLFIGSLIVFAITIFAKPDFIKLDALNGFNVEFKKVDLPRSIITPPNQVHEVFLSNGEGRLHIVDHESNYVLYRLVGVFLDIFIFMIIIYFLQELFKNMAEGNFFIKQNGEFIKYISYLVIASAIVPNIIYYFINIHIENTLHLESVVFKSKFNFDFHTILLGLLIFAISQVFIKGNELKEENELTI